MRARFLAVLSCLGFCFGLGFTGPSVFGEELCDAVPEGMVVWWEGEWDARDRLGVADGSLLNGAGFASGKVGMAFDLTSPGSHVRVPDSEALRFSDALTVEAWVQPILTGVDRNIVTRWDAVVGLEQRSFGLGLLADGRLYLVLSSTGQHQEGVLIVPEALVLPGVWTHVAGTYDGQAIRVYVNGEQVGETGYSAGIFPGSNDLAIGGSVGGLAPGGVITAFGGLIDELSLYDRALTGEEIEGIYLAGAWGKCSSVDLRKPLARWAFDESEGDTAWDSVGTRHGVLSTSGAGFTSGGVRGNALRLDRAAGGYVEMGGGLNLTHRFTLVAWVRTEPGDTTETMVVAGQHSAGTVNGYYLALNRAGFIGQAGKALFVASDPAGDELVSTSSVNDGEWHQVVAVYEAGQGKRLYVDGRPAEASGMVAPMVANEAPFLVGGVSVGGMPQGFFHGWIDEVQVYGRALAEVEIEYLFQNPDAEEIPVDLEPRILGGLQDQAILRGATVEFRVEAEGDGLLQYVWSKDDVLLEDVTGPRLVRAEVEPADGGIYRVEVSNVWGRVSSSATLRVLWPPTITVPPVGQAVSLGGSVTLSVVAEGASPLSYQWTKDNQLVAGGGSQILLLNNVTGAIAGAYRVRVENPDGVRFSDPVWVEVYSGSMRATLVDGVIHFEVNGLQPGRDYLLELTDSIPALPGGWEPRMTILNATETVRFSDTEPAGGNRYYRLRLLP